MNDLTIQIVNYKTKKYLIECLDSLLKDLANSSVNFDVKILDNASGDDLSDISKKYQGKHIEVYSSDKNLGFGAGHNLLSEKSDSREILILNPDTKFIESHTTEKLLQHLDNLNDTAVLGPALVTQKNRIQMWDHGELNKIIPMGGIWRKRKQPTEVSWVSGAVFLIKRDIFEKVGKFDPNFFLYYEELDLCYRIRLLGYKIIYDPTIKILHYGSVVAKRSRKYMRQSKKYLIEKYYRGRKIYPLVKLIDTLIPIN